MPPESLRPWLRADLRRRLLATKNLIAKVAAESFPSPAPVAFCDFLTTVCKTIDDSVDSLETDRQSTLVGNILSDASELIENASHARVLDTPWSLIGAWEDFFRKLIGEHVTLVIRPQWKYNYSTAFHFLPTFEDNLRSVLSKDVSPRFDRFRPDLGVFSFPRTERLSALLHACFGHEVGHMLLVRLIQERFNPAFMQESRKVYEEIKQSAEADARRTPEYYADIWAFVGSTQYLVKRGLEELLADYVGLKVLHFGALFALFQIALQSAPDLPPLAEFNYYPPWRERIRRLKELLTLPKQEVLAQRLSKPLDWVSEYAKLKDATASAPVLTPEGGMPAAPGERKPGEGQTTPGPGSPPVEEIRTKIGYEIINRMLPDFRTRLDALLGTWTYNCDCHAADILELAERLENHILPNKTGTYPEAKPADFRTIINAGWLRRLDLMVSLDEGHIDAVKYVFELDILDRLILKAVEASTVESELWIGDTDEA